ncbi:GTP cyclohydrolase 1 type 2/Nif3 [Pseudomassariella vexata]|uniref:ATP phosphoribosyltransferase n=1 Tax=Pseudomassariella vexata TaxID=1141098 RepID=A0A1Y2DF34_9PEZI|nr:GTP cyclohydrolase 1 type 2/Nif3 [Pseudomassariella vexata]ORY57882.1 GTP cyclohydrolase 1 type 2/Nif3 [Pseudomassariella vexata]
MSLSSKPAHYKLVFFVPPSNLAACKTAIFGAGAGRYPGGKYTECCWTATGTGQFRPGDTANPHIGTVGELEHTEEVRVETLCLDMEIAKRSVAALKSAHPYEQPSYAVYKLEDF